MERKSVYPVLEKSTSICSSGERSSSVSSMTSTSIDTPSDEGAERGKTFKPFSFAKAFQSLDDYIEETCYEAMKGQDNETQDPIVHLIQPDDEDNGENLGKWKHHEASAQVIERPLPLRGVNIDYSLGGHPCDCQQYGIYTCKSCLTTEERCASCKLENRIQARGYSQVEKNFPPWSSIPYNSLLRNAPDIVLYERDLSQGEESFLPERFVLDWRKKLVQADINRELNIHSSKENIKKKKILPKFTLSTKCKSMGQLPISCRSDSGVNRRRQTLDSERCKRGEKEKKHSKSENEEVTWMQICQLMKKSSFDQESDEIRKFLSRRPQMSVTQQTKLKVNLESDKTKFKVQRNKSKQVNSPKRKPQSHVRSGVDVRSGVGDRSRLQSLVFRDLVDQTEKKEIGQSREFKRQSKLDSYDGRVNPIISDANLAPKAQIRETFTSGIKERGITLIPESISTSLKESVKANESVVKRQHNRILTVPKIMINETQRISIESPEVEHKLGPFSNAGFEKSYRSEAKILLKSGSPEVGMEEKAFKMDNQSSQETENVSLYSSLDDLDDFGSSRATPSAQTSSSDYRSIRTCSPTISSDDVPSSLMSMRGHGFSPEKCLLSTISDSERRLSASSSQSSTCRSLQTSPVTVIEVNVSQETDSPISPPAHCDEIHSSSSSECVEESKQKRIDRLVEADDSSLPPVVSFAECDRLLDMLLKGNSKIAYIAEDKAVQCTLLQ